MASYSVLIKRSAAGELEALPKKDRPRVAGRIGALAAEPRPPGCEKLSGNDKFRIRQGDYRIVYAVDDVARTVVVVKVAHRREVCR